MGVVRSIRNVAGKMYKVIFLFLTLLYPFLSYSKTKFEVFLSRHPFLFILSLIGFLLLISGFLLIPQYFMTKFGKEAKNRKRQRIKENVPRGVVSGVNLPPATLYVIRDRVQGMERLKLEPNKEFVIGRGLSNCDLTLEGKKVSYEHAKIRPEGEGYVIYDLGSEGGTKVNGKKIIRKVLSSGDQVKIGKNLLIFELPPSETQERRKHLRLKVPVKFMIYQKKMEECSGETVDISPGGMRFESPRFLPTDSLLEVQVSLGKLSLNTLGVVRWIKPLDKKGERFLVGMEFLEMPDKMKKELEDFIVKEIKESSL